MPDQSAVLCVDDEPLLLEGLSRTLGQNFDVVTETDPVAALSRLERGEREFAVIISDMRMPVMDGARFLARAAQIAPLSPRILLTGQADVTAAAAAVNTGRIFRFLCKPCPPPALLEAVEAGAEQYRLQRIEKDVLEQTLAGSIRLLSEVLILAAPRIFTRTQYVQSYVVYLAHRLGLSDVWRFELAACLSLVGCVGLPEEMAARALSGGPLEEQEARAFAEHPLITQRLLRRIPRFEEIADMVGLQNEAPRGPGPRHESADVVLGARLLGVARAVEQLVSSGASEAEAASRLLGSSDPASAELLQLLAEYRPLKPHGELKELRVNQLAPEMVLERDVKTRAGVVIAPSGQQLSQLVVERLGRFSRAGLLVEPVWVRVPASAS